MPAFAQHNMFDLLNVEDVTHEEEEEVDADEYVSPPLMAELIVDENADSRPVNEQSTEATQPMSKAAKKRAARAAKAAAGEKPAEKKAEKVEKDQKPTSDISTPAPTSNGSKIANGKEHKEAKETKEESKPAPAPAKESAPKPKAEPTKDRQTSAKATEASPPTTPPISSDIPSAKFNPSLPNDLLTPTANQLPSNRKRKTPQDFTPHGPNNLVAPASPNKHLSKFEEPSTASPSKNSVKFEDGVVPGKGRDGEKTISPKAEPKKHQNAVTRTIWTFIMIFGFIGEYTYAV